MKMERIFDNITKLVGSTPLVELGVYASKHCPMVRLLAKLEGQNPAGSAKDRIALEIIRCAEANGSLKPGGMIIEATSGNTGVGLAAISAVLGYKAVIVMPDTMSIERRKLIAAYGAELVLTEGAKGMAGAVEKAREICAQNPGSIIADQFANPAGAAAHYKTTGPEIWSDTDGNISAFVACVGTGGTLSGAGKYLKEQRADIRVFAVEPKESPLLSGGCAAPHKIQGIGANFIPELLDRTVYDEVLHAEDEEAFETMRELAKTEGILCGISSGAAVAAAAQLGKRPEYKGSTIVVLLPDTGERYLSVL